jgi:hypothetical protein
MMAGNLSIEQRTWILKEYLLLAHLVLSPETEIKISYVLRTNTCSYTRKKSFRFAII